MRTHPLPRGGTDSMLRSETTFLAVTLLQYQRGVITAKRIRVVHGNLDMVLAGLIRDVIQITIRIRFIKVHRWGNEIVEESQRACTRLDSGCRAHRVT